MFTPQEIIDYIELEWPEVTDPRHCSAFLTKTETYDDLDKGICFYERNLHN